VRPSVALTLLVLLAPTALAASQVHVTYLGETYAVTFVSNATERVPVTWPDGETLATRVEAPSGDDDPLWRADLPAQALSYTVEGRTFTLPEPPLVNGSTRIVYVADIGVDANARRVIRSIAHAAPDLILIGGDLSYADGDPRIWDRWFELMEPLAANIPVMPAYGNHEDYCTRNDRIHHCGPEANGWHAHFPLPNGEKLYYAFDWGPVRVTVLDTEAYAAGDPFTDKREQEAFLDESLEADEDRWDIVMYHRPLRTTNARPNMASPEAREALEPLLLGRAPLVLQAHLHAYERSHPLNNTTFLTSGGGGRVLYENWSEEEPWVAKRASEFHYVLIEATPTRLNITAIRPDNSTLDSFTLERPLPPRLEPPRPTTPTPTPSVPPTSPTPTPTHTPTRAPTPTPSPPVDNGSGEPPNESSPTPGVGALGLVAAAAVAARLARRVRP